MGRVFRLGPSPTPGHKKTALIEAVECVGARAMAA